jgi:hypothetical protein
MITIMKLIGVISHTKLLFPRLDSIWHNPGISSGNCSFPYVSNSKNILVGIEQTVLVFVTLPPRGLVIGPLQNTRISARPKYFIRASEPACWRESSERYITSAKRHSLPLCWRTQSIRCALFLLMWHGRVGSIPASFSRSPGFNLTQKLDILAEDIGDGFGSLTVLVPWGQCWDNISN